MFLGTLLVVLERVDHDKDDRACVILCLSRHSWKAGPGLCCWFTQRNIARYCKGCPMSLPVYYFNFIIMKTSQFVKKCHECHKSPCICHCLCLSVGQVTCPHHSDQLSERSEVSRTALHCSALKKWRLWNKKVTPSFTHLLSDKVTYWAVVDISYKTWFPFLHFDLFAPPTMSKQMLLIGWKCSHSQPPPRIWSFSANSYLGF